MGEPSIIDRPDRVREWSRERHRSGRSVALVPTMGALHAGHVSLIERACELADETVVSIFVNPLQFGDQRDLSNYPRTLDDDIAVCAEAGVAAVYAPTASAMYPAGFDTRVVPGSLATVMEGASRPGHFEGVATVVTKLFAAVQPDIACFGEKDFQQLAIVRRLSIDLDLGVDVVSVPTIREIDGLAMSSRNRRLDRAGRTAAGCIPTAIAAARRAARNGASAEEIVAIVRSNVDGEPLATLDYVALFDPDQLAPVDRLDAQHRQPGRCRLAIAVRLGDVRLIDNVDLFDR
jgi:pantoate--beta-alanine ligase